jgi:hypothetical protein
MADIFIIYSQVDRELVEKLAKFLTENGYEVWWDTRLVGGEAYRRLIPEKLAEAKAAIVIWTPDSVKSDSVIDESDRARHEGKLITTRIDSLDVNTIPLGFGGRLAIPVEPFEGLLQALRKLGVNPSRPLKPKVTERPPSIAELNAQGFGSGDMIALEHWNFIKNSKNPKDYEKFLGEFADSKLAPLAQKQLDKLGGEAAVHAKLQTLERERNAELHWRAITKATRPEPFDEFLKLYPDSMYAAEARTQLAGVYRAQEESDWHKISQERHPAAFLRFLNAHPNGAHAAEAFQTIVSWSRLIEEEAWNEVKDSKAPIVLQAYQQALPRSRYAKAAGTRLRTLAGGTISAPAYVGATAIPSIAEPPGTRRKRHSMRSSPGATPMESLRSPAMLNESLDSTKRRRGFWARLMSPRDVVDCTVFAPPRVRPDIWISVQVFLHVPERRRETQALATTMDANTAMQGISTLEVELKRGARVQIRLDVPDAEVEENLQTVVWRGHTQGRSFRVSLPAGSDGREFSAKARFFLEGTPIGWVGFVLTSGDGSEDLVPQGNRARRYRHAFISYASEDRAEVKKRTQALRALRIDYFHDILSLDPGDRWAHRLYEEIDRCDLFMLFWSRAAGRSEWVAKEIDRALTRRNSTVEELPDISPIALEALAIAPPPTALAEYHFDSSALS